MAKIQLTAEVNDTDRIKKVLEIIELYRECRSRGYNVAYYGDAWRNVPESMMGCLRYLKAAIFTVVVH